MALSEEEKKIIRAYNIGYSLSADEPRLLQQIISKNKNNEFVKVMAIAKDHHEFNVGIPNKEYTREFKNGFYNARSLSEHNPALIDRMLTSNLHKDYKKGLEAGKKECEVRQLQNKAKQEPKPVAKEYKPNFVKGFNHGYEMSKEHPDVIKLAIDTQQSWSPYIAGLQAGQKQYIQDLADKKTNPQKSAPGKELSDEEYFKLRNRVEGIKDNSEQKQYHLDQPEKKDDTPSVKPSAPLPGWLQGDQGKSKDESANPAKDQDIEPER